MFIRTLVITAVLLGAAPLLSGCAGSESNLRSEAAAASAQAARAADGTDHLTSEPVTFFLSLPNGAKVLCGGVNPLARGDGAASTSIDCDWDNAQGLNKPAPAR